VFAGEKLGNRISKNTVALMFFCSDDTFCFGDRVEDDFFIQRLDRMDIDVIIRDALILG
jgi:hypothetical protein